MIDNSTRMTVTQYAAHRQVDHALVSRWKSGGRLVLDSDGKILVRASDAVLSQELDRQRGGKGGGPGAEAAGKRATEIASGGSLAEATRDEKVKRSRLLELEIAEREGALVSADEVRAEAQRVAHGLRGELMAIADRLADPLAAETDSTRIHAMLMTEFRKLAGLLAQARAEVHAVAA